MTQYEESRLQHYKKRVLNAKNGSEEIIYENRDIITRLLSLSTRFEKSIDFRYALRYPLLSLQKGYAMYNIVADTYRESSIKSVERSKRGI